MGMDTARGAPYETSSGIGWVAWSAVGSAGCVSGGRTVSGRNAGRWQGVLVASTWERVFGKWLSRVRCRVGEGGEGGAVGIAVVG